jgi:hypothetical protein
MKFENFLADVGPRPPGTSLDRYPNPFGSYELNNVRWATPKQQRHNRRDQWQTQIRAWIYEFKHPNGEYVSECAGQLNVDIPVYRLAWRPRLAPELEKRIKKALSKPGRPSVRMIAERFRVSSSAVQQISRPRPGKIIFGRPVPAILGRQYPLGDKIRAK